MVKQLNELVELHIKDDKRCVSMKTNTEEVYIPVVGKEIGKVITAYFSSVTFGMLGKPTTESEIPDEANAVLFSPLEEIASTEKGVRFQGVLYQVELPEYKLASEASAVNKKTY